MTLDDQIAACRVLLADTRKPPLWSDDELRLYLNEAQNEAAERGQLILDIDTPEVCEIQVRAGVRIYELHQSVLKIKRAKLDLGDRPLIETSAGQMDQGGAGWFPSGLNQYPPNATWFPGGSNWEALEGTPERYIHNDLASITLIRIPVADDVLRLQVTRLPLCPMKNSQDEPEIAARYHFRMLDWALRCAYLKQDSETFDPKKGQRYEDSFTLAFGQRPDANVQRKRRASGPRAVTMGSW